jgi:aminoglycoside/choline kinase family phosphotransferase
VDLGVVPAVVARARRTSKAAGKVRSVPPALEEMLAGFVATAELLDLGDTVGKLKAPAVFGADLARVAATRATLEAAVGGYVSVAEAVKILGVGSRQAVHQRIARGTLLAIDVAGQTVLPTYQFDGEHVRSEFVQAAKLLARAGLSEIAVVSWFVTRQPELEGSTPAEWIAAGQDAALVYDAARHTAGTLAH